MIWLTSATATASSSRKPPASSRTGTPRAAAASGSRLAKSNGRAVTARMASTRTAATARTYTWLRLIPRKLPKSRAFSPPRKPG